MNEVPQAENPDVGFRPTSGKIKELNFRVSPHVWGYFSVYGRGAVHPKSQIPESES